MEPRLNIAGLFETEEELCSLVRKRRICYDSEPYYITRKGGMIQIGYQLNLYGTFPPEDEEASPDDREFGSVLRDVRRVAEVLSQTCDPLHMCESAIEDSASVTYSPDRKMRPDVTVHIPVFDQQDFGHAVDERIRNTLALAGRMLESVGVQKKNWKDERRPGA